MQIICFSPRCTLAWFPNTVCSYFCGSVISCRFLAAHPELLTALYFSSSFASFFFHTFLHCSSTVPSPPSAAPSVAVSSAPTCSPVLFHNFYFYEQISETAKVRTGVISAAAALMPSSVICLLTSFSTSPATQPDRVSRQWHFSTAKSAEISRLKMFSFLLCW